MPAGITLEGVSPEPVLLRGNQHGGHRSGWPSGGGGHLHRSGQLRRQPRYASGAASTTFTHCKATPTLSVSGGASAMPRFPPRSTSRGSAAFRGDDRQPGRGQPDAQLLCGAELQALHAAAPSAVGTYTVLASFAGSTDYANGTRHDVHHRQGCADVSVSDKGGTFTTTRMAATPVDRRREATTLPATSLEGITPSLSLLRGYQARLARR